MNDETCSARRSRPDWPRSAGLLAFMAGIAILAAGCGGNPSAAAGGLAAYQQALPFAQCMRSHGIGNFPDPEASGNFDIGDMINQNSPQYAAAKSTCVRLHPYNMVLSPQQAAAMMSRALAFARCMRSHGVPNFPDPVESGGRLSFGRQTSPSPPPGHNGSSPGAGSGQRGTGSGRPATGAPRQVTSPSGPPELPQYAPVVSTAMVTRRDLSSQTPVNATLGYAGSYTVTGQGSGTLTWLPAQGRVIGQGQVLYRVDNGIPVILLYGTVPAWRSLDDGETGTDVTQLNHDLVRLGYASGADIAAAGWDYFSWASIAGVDHLQMALGITSPSGSLVLGSVVFEPSALRVTSVTGSLGSPAAGAVLAATSARHVVTIDLDAAQQTEVKSGEKVAVTLPDGSVTPGVISSVGSVATGAGASATIPVYVRLTHPRVAGRLDQAPVSVEITASTVPGVLAVPVGALLARSSGGYAVEVAGAAGARHLVTVTTGIFDDASGLVQVTGTGLAVGQFVVVPSA